MGCFSVRYEFFMVSTIKERCSNQIQYNRHQTQGKEGQPDVAAAEIRFDEGQRSE